MVGNPNTWWGTHAWWGAHIHGGLASQPARPDFVKNWRGPWVLVWDPAPVLPKSGQAITYLLAPSGWLARQAPHHVFGFPTMYFVQRYQVSWNGDGPSELRMELRVPHFSANKGHSVFHLTVVKRSHFHIWEMLSDLSYLVIKQNTRRQPLDIVHTP